MSLSDDLYRVSPIWLQNVLLNLYGLRVHHERYGAEFRKLLEEWRQSEWWDPERIRSWQDTQLSQIVRYAYEQIPFYRRKYDAYGVQPDDIRGVSDLVRLPVLTKDEVRSAGRDLTTRRSGLVHGHTSGTTGTPLDLWYDHRMCVVNNVADWRQKTWAGMRPGDWCGVLLGRIVVPIDQQEPPFWRVNWIQNQIWFSSFHLSPENLPDYVEEIRRRNLSYLEGYPSTLFILARHLLSRGERLQLEAVFTSSETLHTVQRETIREAFGCPVYDFYGLAERVVFAGECDQHHGKHVFPEYSVVEIVNDEGEPVPDGERGWITGTTLWNRGMPLIRYRTSDLSAFLPDACPCGRHLSRLAPVTTKAEDIVVTPDGRYISPSVLTHPFKPFHQLQKSQIIQETPDEVLVKLVPGPDFGSAQEDRLLDRLRDRLGDSITVRSARVEDIPPEPSGKFRWVVSKVDHSCQFSWGDDPSHRTPSTADPAR